MARTTNYSWLLLSLVLPCAVVPCVGENPLGCRIFRGILVCLFQYHSLTDLPSGIPDDVVSLDASFNSIRNLTHVPLLYNLCTLNLRSNRIETVSWVSLRRLPALQNIHLNDNKITSVNLDVVINHLPDLKLVDLSSNRLTSVSVQGLGLPFLEKVNIDSNPFNCDCALLWLMNKVRCLQECPRAGPVLENNTSIQEVNSKEISKLAIGSEQIIIMVSVSFLALLFILYIMRKIRRVTSEDDIGAAANVLLKKFCGDELR
ncbi:PREDICTED: leucine-rich repeat transmembrane protein FLRT2-like [Branchiostoma belcheri]|uniref:Leucine-rich repeat transmembrane protein FLRT2-like n=1 Tax=Branchiostoma belcheri TaxID=7741 RepID=A0A6P4Y2Z8_BRABE|nr:PREDICTED: leucine-rich repeat transmembrane protein FLRT2-like [Branchiostoma belcheri]